MPIPWKISICLLAVVLCSCRQQQPDGQPVFIVPADTMPVYPSNGQKPSPPPPARAFYFPSNFIADTGNHIFFYQQPALNGLRCGTGLQWDSPPAFIDLQPEDISEIPAESVESFLQANLRFLDVDKRYVAIASTADTIQSATLGRIIRFCKDSVNHIRWKFRKATLEESVVLSYKKRGAMYNYEDIAWDSTKVLFPPKPSVILFTRPRLEE